MNLQNHFDDILDELGQTLARVSKEDVERLLDAIVKAQRVFVAGAGRSGLVMRGFAMRLMQMGFEAYVVGETVTPGIGEADLLLVGSGSGATAGLVVSTEKARAAGAQISLITARADSPIGGEADIVVVLPTPIPRMAQNHAVRSIQLPGSLFEQSLMVVLDVLVVVLMARCGENEETMLGRHANLQ